MTEIEVVSILKQCSDKKIDKVIKIPRFLYAAIWPHLTHSWPGLKHIKHLDIVKYIINTFPLQTYLAC